MADRIKSFFNIEEYSTCRVKYQSQSWRVIGCVTDKRAEEVERLENWESEMKPTELRWVRRIAFEELRDET